MLVRIIDQEINAQDLKDQLVYMSHDVERNELDHIASHLLIAGLMLTQRAAGESETVNTLRIFEQVIGRTTDGTGHGCTDDQLFIHSILMLATMTVLADAD